jgi:hypothetical protein
MQRRKNIRLVISLIVMIAAILLLAFFVNRDGASFADMDLFQINDLDKIDQVVLESPRGKTALKFNGTKWKVNESNDADRQMITVLFATLKQTIAKREVAITLRDSISHAIVSTGVKVSCYEGGQLVRSFFSGGNAQQTETYFMQEGGAPYLVVIPGYRVFIAAIFDLTGNDWRDKQVFNFNWQNIKSVEVSFPSNPKQDFHASFKNNFFGIDEIAATDTSKLDRFMDDLFQLRAKKIMTDEELRKVDSTSSAKPAEIITIRDVAGNQYALTILSAPSQRTTLLASINNQFILLDVVQLRELARPRDFFKPAAE